MKPRTLDLILKACLVSMVLDLPVFYFNVILGASVMIIATSVLLFSGWKAWKLIQTDPNALKTLPESEKELSLKDLPPRLIVALVASLVILVAVQVGVFSFSPLADIALTAAAILLFVYYFFQKRRLRKKV